MKPFFAMVFHCYCARACLQCGCTKSRGRILLETQAIRRGLRALVQRYGAGVSDIRRGAAAAPWLYSATQVTRIFGGAVGRENFLP